MTRSLMLAAFALTTTLFAGAAQAGEIKIYPVTGSLKPITHVGIGPTFIHREVFTNYTSGIELEVLSGNRGLLVRRVSTHGYASAAGLEAGDVITRINGMRTSSRSRFEEGLYSARGDAWVQVVDVRTGYPVERRMFLPVSPSHTHGGYGDVITVLPVDPTPPPVEFGGWWYSAQGDLRIWQHGDRFDGRLHMPNGRIAILEGRISQDSLTFEWMIDQNMRGTGELTMSRGGELIGSYQTLGGNPLAWKLSREE